MKQIQIIMGLQFNKHNDKVSKKDALKAVDVLTKAITLECGGATINYGLGTYTHKSGEVATEKNIQISTIATTEQIEYLKTVCAEVRNITAQESILFLTNDIKEVSFI